MDPLFAVVLYCALAFVAILLIRVTAGAGVLSHSVYFAQTPDSVSAQEVPEWLGSHMAHGIEELEALGFESRSILRMNATTKGLEPRFFHLLEHREMPVEASLSATVGLDGRVPYLLELTTPLGDGTVLSTLAAVQARLFPLAHPRVRSEIVMTQDAKVLLDAHNARLAASGMPAIGRWSTEDPLTRFEIELRERLEAGVESGLLYERGGGFKPTTKLIARTVFSKADAAYARFAKELQAKVGRAWWQSEFPARLAAESLLRSRGNDVAGNRAWAGISLGLTAILSYCFFFLVVKDHVMASIILGSLVLHEGGHFLASKLLGFRDNSMILLPGFGAVAMGDDREGTAWKRVTTLFAGPLPGLAFATAVIVAAPDSLTAYYAFIPFFLNLFNLLPFHPLDGGQILDTALLRGSHFVRAGFKAFSAAGLVAHGIATGSAVTALIGSLVFMSLPRTFRLARIASKARRIVDPAEGEATRLSSAIALARDEGEGKRAYSTALALSKSLAERKPSRIVAIASLALYLAALVGVPVLLFSRPETAWIGEWLWNVFAAR